MRDERPRAHNSTLRIARAPMKKLNPDRERRNRAKQFGTDGKREWIMSMVCAATGEWGSDLFPIDPAHVGSPDPNERRAGQNTRGNGADATYLLPLRRDVHRTFDSEDAHHFEELWGVSKQWCREMAAQLDVEWRAMHPTQTEGE